MGPPSYGRVGGVQLPDARLAGLLSGLSGARGPPLGSSVGDVARRGEVDSSEGRFK